MLQNITNFFNLIAGRFIKTTPEDSDLIALGTKDHRYGGGYKPTGITVRDFKDSIPSVPYKVLTLSLQQSGIDPPDAPIVFENTFGVDYEFFYDAPGTYIMEFDQSMFQSPADYVTITGVAATSTPSPGSIKAFPIFFNVLVIVTMDSSGAPIDSAMTAIEPTILEIRLYN